MKQRLSVCPTATSARRWSRSIVPAGDVRARRAEDCRSSASPAWPISRCPSGCFSQDALPRNAMGKVQKNLLRERYADSFA